ncbi:hypothetical protein [Caloranaerobacter sp. TR13]|uniref:hypothetical protein n=1 Tax=Caloranaerobacter sp. TR13 TaxID=1302151 RepID=UPI0006D3F047|nr:hypothetical protein [Caloranaerobacter sp. TR13]
MVKISSPYSDAFKEAYWNWFKNHYEVNDNTKLSEIFIEGKYMLEKDFLLKDVIISDNTYIEISTMLKKADKSIIKSKYDFVDEYERFVSRDSDKESAKMNAVKLYKEIDIKVCPYCNLNDISYYKDVHGTKRGHLDHFYCKKDYPYLALSIYNLVPICSTCNSSFKGSKSTNIKNYIHPYFECFGDEGRFILIMGQAMNSLQEDTKKSSNTYIALRYGKNSYKVRNNNKLFHLAYDDEQGILGVYQQEIEYAVELLKKFRNYSPELIDSLYRTWKKLSSKEDIKKEDFENNIFDKRIPEEQMVNHRRAKLHSDLYKEYYEERYNS